MAPGLAVTAVSEITGPGTAALLGRCVSNGAQTPPPHCHPAQDVLDVVWYGNSITELWAGTDKGAPSAAHSGVANVVQAHFGQYGTRNWAIAGAAGLGRLNGGWVGWRVCGLCAFTVTACHLWASVFSPNATVRPVFTKGSLERLRCTSTAV